MTKQIITNYAFLVSGKTVTLSDFGSSHPVDLKRLYLITDVTTNNILYNFADSTVATATISSYNVINLSAVVSGSSSSDSLQIVYEVLSTDPTYETPLLPSNTAQETGGNLATLAGAITSSKMQVNVTNSSIAVTGTFYQATQPVSGTVTANAGTNLNTSLLALESGGNLATIATNTGKIPSLGQALAAGSVPVVLTAAQITTLTPPAAITNYAQETGGNLATLAGAVTSSVMQTNISKFGGTSVTIGQQLAAASIPVILPSATITTLTPPSNTGYSTSTLQTTGNTSLSTIATNTTNAGTPTLQSGSTTAVTQATATNLKAQANSYDGSGTAINSLSAGTGQNGLGVSLMAFNFPLSTGNSTTSQLTAGSTFTGTIESIAVFPAISVDMTSDQNGTLILNQYIDNAGTYKVSSWSYSIVANTPYSRSFAANGNYFNLTFHNTSGSSTTTLNISTAYGAIEPSTNLGNTPVSINEINGTMLNIGQQSAANSIPVILPSATITSLTQPTLQSGSTTAVTQATASNLNATVTPAASTGSAIPSVAQPVGFQARTSEQAVLTNADLYMGVVDKVGKLITLPFANPENFMSAVASATGTSDTAVISAQGSGLFLYITSISVANTGATASLVTIEWDTASAKTAAWYLINPAGGGDNITFPNPLKAPVANKNVGFVCGSSSSTQYVSISGYYGL